LNGPSGQNQDIFENILIFAYKNIYNIYAINRRKERISVESLDNILEKASKCLNCKNPMCRQGCPIATNIPNFISKIKENNFEEAYYILQENNLMSEICSIVCPVENQCMGSCVRGIKGEPVEINQLEKFINNWAKDNNITYEPNVKSEQNRKVAIIGAGPAGIACAVELRKAGINVTIFEKDAKAGGILEYGIPDFRLEKSIVENIIDKVKQLEINIETGVELGKDITLETLKEQGYENIFLGIGAQKQSTYKLTDEETQDIFRSDDFLKKYNTGEKLKDLGITVVIGGGNVAFDSARTAIRMGAKEVYILYRRNEELMPARKIELQEAIEDGVKVIFQTKVTGAKLENGKIKEIECIKTKIENEKAVDIEGSNYTMEANTIIFAIGAKANEQFFDNLGIKTEYGLVCVDKNYMTNIKGVYAGGDSVETKSSVCRAIATGKKAAQAILNRKGSDK